MRLWLAFSIAALMLWGVSGVTQKLSTNHVSSKRSFLWFCWAMVALSAVTIAFARPQWNQGTLVVGCSIAGGVTSGLGTWACFRALESGGKASIVISLISLNPLLTVILAVVLLGERLTPKQIVGVITAIVAAVLLSLESPHKAKS